MTELRDQQQKLSQQPPFGTPAGLPTQQQANGVARAIAFVRGLSGQAVVLAVAVFALQAIMPTGSKPSDLIGSFHGGTNTAQLDAERAAQAKTALDVEGARAKAQAQWAMEQEIARQQQEAIMRSLAAKQDAANLADYACMGGAVAGALFGRDAADLVNAARLACDQAERLRGEIIAAQAQAARLGSGLMQRPAPVVAPQR